VRPPSPTPGPSPAPSPAPPPAAAQCLLSFNSQLEAEKHVEEALAALKQVAKA
jgi:hypothetical protein